VCITGFAATFMGFVGDTLGELHRIEQVTDFALGGGGGALTRRSRGLAPRRRATSR